MTTAIAMAISAAAVAQFAPVQHEGDYQLYIDLTAEAADRLPIELVTPILPKGKVVYNMPKMVPGTYSIYDFGRFVKEFQAFDTRGNQLEVNQLNVNQWEIVQGEKLYKIKYWVDDSFDDTSEPHIFDPAGSSFRQGEVFLLNLFNMVGYLEGYKNMPFELEVEVPDGMYGVTALDDLNEALNKDHFSAPTYFELHDNPILYAKPDTTTLQVNNTEVIVGVWSENGIVTAAEAMEASAPVLQAIGNYLGGTLPTDRYAILLYVAPPNMDGSSSMGYGALEHHRSTSVTMPEFESPELYSEIRHIVAHEFLHIVTPLQLHSEYVADFDFVNPEMSQHLWLYEGVTEYTSLLVQVREGLITREEFLEEMHGKLEGAEDFNSKIPFTVMSKHVLTFFEDQYLNVYQYGSVIGMGVDLKLRVLSEGEMGLKDLLSKVGADYGTDTFFVDLHLFDILAEASGYPTEMREFFARHIEGAEPMPFEELLAPFGIGYQEEYSFMRPSFGGFGFGYNEETGRLMAEDVSELDAFGKELGIEEGDEIVEWNGEEFTIFSAQGIVEKFLALEEGTKVKIKVMRKNKKGVYKEKTLKAKVLYVSGTRRHQFELKDNQPAPLRGNWMGNPNNN